MAITRYLNLRCPVDFHGEKRILTLLWLLEAKGTGTRAQEKLKKGHHWARGNPQPFGVRYPVLGLKLEAAGLGQGCWAPKWSKNRGPKSVHHFVSPGAPTLEFLEAEAAHFGVGFFCPFQGKLAVFQEMRQWWLQTFWYCFRLGILGDPLVHSQRPVEPESEPVWMKVSKGQSIPVAAPQVFHFAKVGRQFGWWLPHSPR